MTLSLLLLRRLSHLRCRPPKTNQPFSSISSSSLQTNPNPNPNPDPNTSSLSARMNFVFDQIDAIEQQRSHQKDDTLQRIRAWRDSKKKKTLDNISPGEVEVGPTEAISQPQRNGGSSLDRKVMVEVVHPWQEWVELMEMLARQNYFDHRRRDEDKLVRDLGFDNIREGITLDEEGFDFSRDFKTVQTACLNFGRDRFDILRSLSRQDIQVLVGYGCPSTERKVVFSSKLLRKLVHLDEGDVCSSCSLRSSCERGYLITNKEDEAMTFDIMRVLLTYGFDPVNGSVVNETLLKKKSIKTVVRKLLHEVVKLGALPIDPNLPPPVIKKPPPKVKQTPPPPKKRVGRDDIEMKRGDWLCPKCDFMNFAKNTVCLQCDAKRPKRQLLPGEWECPECKFLNYRRNMACFHCDCKRPPDEFTEIQMEDRQRGPRMRLQKVPSRTEVSDAWNLDFDDNESDGADVAAFEYADSRRLDEEFSHDRQGGEENSRRAEGDYFHNSRPARPQERDYSARGPNNPGTGFDDFDDEEDDIESYELDSHSGNEGKKSSSIPFSDLDVNSDSEDTETASDNWNNSLRVDSPRNSKSSKPLHRKTAFSGSNADELDFDSDEELPVHRNWGSTHVAESRQRNRGRGRIDYGSDEDPGLSSEPEDDFPSRQNKGNGRGSTKGRGDNYKGESSDFESDDEGGRFSSGGSRGSLAGPDRRTNTSKGRGGFSSTEDSEPRARSMTGDRNKPFKGKFDRSPRGYRGDNRGFQAGDYGGRRKISREGDSDSFRSPGRDNFGNKPYGRNAREGDSDSFRSPRRDNFGNKLHGRNAREGDSDSFRSPGRDNFGNKPHGRNAREGDSDSFRSPGRDNFGNKPHGRNAREGDSDSFRSPRRDSFDTKQHKRYNNLGGSSTRDSYLDEERYTRPRVNVR